MRDYFMSHLVTHIITDAPLERLTQEGNCQSAAIVNVSEREKSSNVSKRPRSVKPFYETKEGKTIECLTKDRNSDIARDLY